jgi:enoyl-CoA hydratase
MLDASEALKWGLIDEVVRPEELKQRVQAYAEDLASKPAAALAAIRRTVTLGGGMTFEEGMSLEMEAATDLAGTADFAEGVSAFLNKLERAVAGLL